MPERTRKQAKKVVEDYIERRFKESHKRLTKEKHGDGCGCWTCRKQAVDDANDWADMAAGGLENNPIRHKLNKKGDIRTGYNPDFKRKDE